MSTSLKSIIVYYHPCIRNLIYNFAKSKVNLNEGGAYFVDLVCYLCFIFVFVMLVCLFLAAL